LVAVKESLDRTAEQVREAEGKATAAREQYHETTRRVFRAYFARLREAADALDFQVEGRLEPREDGRFEVDIRVRVGDKPAVHHDSQDLSGGQKAALSILMGMTAVSLESDGAGFFLIDEPFAASDINKINELGSFLALTEAQYLLSMPTSSDLERCGPWLGAVWTTTRTRGGLDERGRPVLAPPVRQGFVRGAREG
jgi:ATPase subunit of ABC transporter with duplicated ATPase domains